MDLKNFREIIREKPLLESEALKDPVEFLEQWIQDAIDAGIRQPNAMTLSTVDSNGAPQSRVVLLKEIVKGKLSFFTDYESPKSLEIIQNPYVALTFLWFDINRQIRISGTAEKTSREYSENYFSTRPRDSRIAATISDQSQKISSREELEKKYSDFEKEFEGKEIPIPDNWGGFFIEPKSFEFWQGRSGRLHDRLKYTRSQSSWDIKRLNP